MAPRKVNRYFTHREIKDVSRAWKRPPVNHIELTAPIAVAAHAHEVINMAGMLGKAVSRATRAARGRGKKKGAIGRIAKKIDWRKRSGFGGMAPRGGKRKEPEMRAFGASKPKSRGPKAAAPKPRRPRPRRAEEARPSPFSRWGEGMMGGPSKTQLQDRGSHDVARKARFRRGGDK